MSSDDRSQTKGISILLVDDHPVVRQGYRRVWKHQSDFRVVAEADDAATAYRAFKTHAPDIVVMDISMPGASGLEAIRNIRMRHSASRILVFSMHSEAALVKAAFSAGASGYVTKSSEPAALVKAIRAVARGEHAMSDDIAHVPGDGKPVPARDRRSTSWGKGRSRSSGSWLAARPQSRSPPTSISASRPCKTITI
jgi:DNA-binding NarL/FixJ family response regulator